MDKEVRHMMKSFVPGLVLVLLLWLIKGFEWGSGMGLVRLGVLPRTASGLVGILTSPLIHDDLEHLVSNSIPLLLLMAGLVYFYRDLWFRVFVWIYLLGGFWLWLGGRESYHIGASGLVYGITAFIFISGILRRDIRLMALSLLVAFLYGGMVWGMFPIFRKLSWEAHLFGALAGVLMALVYRREGPQRKQYDWERDDALSDADVPDGPDAYWRIPPREPEPSNPVQIHYIYKPADSKTDDEKN